MRISDWSSDVCSSDLPVPAVGSPIAGIGTGRLVLVDGQAGVDDAKPDVEMIGIVEPAHIGHDIARFRLFLDPIGLQGVGEEGERRVGIKDRKSVVTGKSVAVRVALGGSGIIQKKKKQDNS